MPTTQTGAVKFSVFAPSDLFMASLRSTPPANLPAGSSPLHGFQARTGDDQRDREDVGCVAETTYKVSEVIRIIQDEIDDAGIPLERLWR